MSVALLFLLGWIGLTSSFRLLLLHKPECAVCSPIKTQVTASSRSW